MAGCIVAGPEASQPGFLLLADGLCEWAAGAESALRGWIDRRGSSPETARTAAGGGWQRGVADRAAGAAGVPVPLDA